MARPWSKLKTAYITRALPMNTCNQVRLGSLNFRFRPERNTAKSPTLTATIAATRIHAGSGAIRSNVQASQTRGMQLA